MSAYSKVLYKGKYVSAIDKEILDALATILDYGNDLTLTQGGYNAGNVKASAGTHDGGAAFDLSFHQAVQKSWWLRLLGVAAYRRFAPTFTSNHIHGVVIGNTSASSGAKHQVAQYLNGTNGLANYGKDQDRRPINPNIQFVFGARKGDWYTKKTTYGYSQPTRKATKVATRDKNAFHIVNIATVKVWEKSVLKPKGQWVEWIVTKNGTFYKKSDLVTTAPIKIEKKKESWIVNRDSLNGYDKPNGKAKVKRKRGFVLYTNARTTVKGETWVRHPAGKWYRKAGLLPKDNAPVVKATIRLETFNIPDEDKIKGESTRAKSGANLVKQGNFDVLGLNELVGPGKESPDNNPSAFAKKFGNALGSTYQLIVPTSTWNENYIVINKTTTRLVKKHVDALIYSGNAPGKHVTRVVLEDIESGLIYAVGQTHLGSNKEASELERQDQAAKVVSTMQAVSKAHGDCPIFIMGDMNTSSDLKAFVQAGLKNARKVAKVTTNKNYSTYVQIKDSSPNATEGWVIDQIYVPQKWNVDSYEVVIEGSRTKFSLPRSSDHLPVLVSVSN